MGTNDLEDFNQDDSSSGAGESNLSVDFDLEALKLVGLAREGDGPAGESAVLPKMDTRFAGTDMWKSDVWSSQSEKVRADQYFSRSMEGPRSLILANKPA